MLNLIVSQVETWGWPVYEWRVFYGDFLVSKTYSPISEPPDKLVNLHFDVKGLLIPN